MKPIWKMNKIAETLGTEYLIKGEEAAEPQEKAN